MSRWVVEIPGPRAGRRMTPWVRHKSLPAEATVEEVRELVDSLARSFGCARASNGTVEVGRHREFSYVGRKS